MMRKPRRTEPTAPAPRWSTAFAAAILCAAGLAAYHNSFAAPFVFDGVGLLRDQPALRTLWPPWPLLTSTTRPVGLLSFALNYAVGDTNVWDYHVTNLAIHVAAALALLGIVRRTLARGRLAPRFAASAWGLALAVALLWLVHPLQTQAVTYIVQRYESLMGLFFLLTLYAFVRALDAPRPGRWYAASAACCLLAVATKEVAAVAPLVVLWYDRALVAGSWREIAVRRWGAYLGLAASWVLLGAIMLGHAQDYPGSGALVVEGVTPLQYALTQPGVIVHYLRLALWPTGLCLDHGWPVARGPAEIVPPMALVGLLLGATAVAIFRWPEWSFLGGWFFLILAPTSSVLPINDLAVEHRMYLPLAAVIAAAVFAAHAGCEKVLTAGVAASRCSRRNCEPTPPASCRKRS